MEEKYAKMTDEFTFSGKQCKLTKGGMYFNLQLETNTFETDKVSLTAVHVSIFNASGAKKVERMGGDLGNL